MCIYIYIYIYNNNIYYACYVCINVMYIYIYECNVCIPSFFLFALERILISFSPLDVCDKFANEK